MKKSSFILTTQKNISQEIIEILLGSGFSKNSIALKINASITTVNNLLKGKVKTPRLKIFSKLLGLYFSTQMKCNDNMSILKT